MFFLKAISLSVYFEDFLHTKSSKYRRLYRCGNIVTNRCEHISFHKSNTVLQVKRILFQRHHTTKCGLTDLIGLLSTLLQQRVGVKDHNICYNQLLHLLRLLNLVPLGYKQTMSPKINLPMQILFLLLFV